MSVESATPTETAAHVTFDDDGQPQGFLNADARGGTVGTKESFTIAEAADQLLRGTPGWSFALGQAFTVTYAYRASTPSAMPDDTAGFTQFNEAQIAQTELALASWSDVANIRFMRVVTEGAYSNQASILFGNYSSGADGAVAFAYYPGSTSASSLSGDVWVNSTKGTNSSPAVGNYGGQVLVHEIGHAIGLGHPGDYDSSDTESPTYADSAAYYEDSRQFTVMSYFGETNTGANHYGGYSAAPLLDDIAAAQLAYGANTATRTGDTVYGFNSTADRPWFLIDSLGDRPIFAVWDAGGTDTFDFSGYSNNQVIDLRPGFFSNVGALTGNVAVAAGATIENALGGKGMDTIHGNEAANSIVGGAGDDDLWGGGGNDTLRADEGLNFLRGEAGDDIMYGGGAFDDIHGNMGNDTGFGGAGSDWVVGGQDRDQLHGDIGDDVIYGNMGEDTAWGDAGNDLIRGGQDNDVLLGGDDDDWISGDKGSDTIWGGGGADIFHTWGQAGIDQIMDFSRALGDRVLVTERTPYTVAQSGDNVVIDMGGGNQMILVGVQMASLTEGWVTAY
jgi:serralysin